MTNIITKFNETGICIIDIKKCIKEWNKKDSISQWHDEYRLIKLRYKKHIILKVTISEKQAKELIYKLGLGMIKSTVFNHAITWKLIGGNVRGKESFTSKIYCANCSKCILFRLYVEGSKIEYRLRVKCLAGKWKKTSGADKLFKYFSVIKRVVDTCDGYDSMGDNIHEYLQTLYIMLPSKDFIYSGLNEDLTRDTEIRS